MTVVLPRVPVKTFSDVSLMIMPVSIWHSLRLDVTVLPNFPENKRYGFFPSFSLGWRISEESFMKQLTFLDNLKIRGSYGKMGNDLVDPFQYLTTYKFDSNYVVGGNDVTGLVR